MYNIFFEPVKKILSIKENTEKALQRLGIKSLRDLVFYKPTSFSIINISPDLSNLIDEELIQAEVTIIDVMRPPSPRSPLKVLVGNETGQITLVFFNKLAPFIFKNLRINNKCIITGKVHYFDGFFQITHPDFIFKKELGVSVLPIYPLTYGINNKQLYNYIYEGIKILERVVKINDNDISDQTKYILELIDIIKQLHLIEIKLSDPTYINQSLNEAVHKLSIKELYANQAALLSLKKAGSNVTGQIFKIDKSLQQNILNNINFKLTEAQIEAIKEIEEDQANSRQMMRLLQGDVGSGKTLVALMTMLNVISSNAQCALMVPTDLLSYQHYQFFKQALLLEEEGDNNIKIALLTGKTTSKERKEILFNLENGKINILIGTHALFQEGVNFKNLGYIVIDEQHRFGVEQRLQLIKKASHPDVLIMTATPIPRSLTLTMFGDLNVSKLKSKPKNRHPIITNVISLSKKEELIHSLKKKTDIGEKIYWVCPLIDQNDKIIQEEEGADSDNILYADVMSRFAEINKIYPTLCAVLHGKMKGIEKDEVMQKFKEGQVKILIATTVIEVGIDVPDSTLIIIEDAQKFGLAALHQLRGRVGRGSIQSHCVLIYNPQRTSKMARQRLQIMKESNDGFYIAEQDLLLRGGGEIRGTKQSGEPEFFFANLSANLDILLDVNKQVKNVLIDEFITFQIKLFAKNHQDLTKSG